MGRAAILFAVLAAMASPAVAQELWDHEPIEEDGYWPSAADVATRFIAAFPDECGQVVAGKSGADLQPDIYELNYRLNFDFEDDPARRLTLYRFDCAYGVYSAFQVYMAVTEYRGVTALSFAEPLLAEAVVMGTEPRPDRIIEGFAATSVLADSQFDPATGSIVSTKLWRSAGDAYLRALYELVGGAFVLRTVEVDSEFDNRTAGELVFDHGISR